MCSQYTMSWCMSHPTPILVDLISITQLRKTTNYIFLSTMMMMSLSIKLQANLLLQILRFVFVLITVSKLYDLSYKKIGLRDTYTSAQLLFVRVIFMTINEVYFIKVSLAQQYWLHSLPRSLKIQSSSLQLLYSRRKKLRFIST